MESRVLFLERAVAEITAEVAVAKTNNTHLTDAVKSLQKSVDDLTAVINRSRGALWAVGSIAAMLGAISAMIADFFARR